MTLFWTHIQTVISRFHGQYLDENLPKNGTENADSNGGLGDVEKLNRNRKNVFENYRIILYKK